MIRRFLAWRRARRRYRRMSALYDREVAYWERNGYPRFPEGDGQERTELTVADQEHLRAVALLDPGRYPVWKAQQ